MSDARVALYLAGRFLFGARSLRHVLSLILGMSISLVPLLVIQEASTGMIEGIVSRFVETGTYHLRAEGFFDTEAQPGIIDAIEGIEGVKYAAYEKQDYALVSSDTRRAVVSVRAVSPRFWNDETFIRLTDLRAGSRQLSSARDIVLGEEMARELDVEIGDRVVLLSTPQDFAIPRPLSMYVQGIVSTGYRDLDRLWSFVSLEHFDSRGSEYIGIKVEDPFSLPNPFSRRLVSSSAAKGETLLGEIAEVLYPDWGVLTWYEMERSRYETFRTTFALLRFVMILVLLVASVTIAVSLIRIVIERETELAVLKSLGASPRLVQMSFLISGAVIGTLAVVGGLLLSALVLLSINDIVSWIEVAVNKSLTLIAWIARRETVSSYALLNTEFYLSSIPVRLRFSSFWAVGTGAVLLAFLAAWIPSRRASRVLPAILLRGRV